MQKNLSPLNLLWISFTSMIGSGWLFGSLYSAHYAGPAAIIAWPLAGFLLFFVALSYAEVATMFPHKNNLASLPLYTHGRLTSVILNILAWISLATIPVIETQGLIQYASNYFPSLVTHDGLHYTTTWMGYFIALIILLSFVVLNYFGLRFFARINDGFTIWKILIPCITIIALLSTSFHAVNFSAHGGFMPYGWQGVMAAMSNGGVLFSLLGFRQVVIMASEIENPGKHVPLILILSLLLTSILYTCLQFSFIGSLRPGDLTQGWANLSFVGDAGPFAALALIAGLVWLSMLLYADAFISPFSTGLVYSTTASEMLAGISKIGDAPASLKTRNSYQSPYKSLITNFILAASMFFLLRNWQAMSAFLVTVLMASYAMGPICLICFRKQLPDYSRPFRLHGAWLITFLGFFICTAGIYWAGLGSNARLMGMTTLILIFYISHHKLHKSREILDSKNAIWLLFYFLGLFIFSYLGNYGGKQLLPPYWDLLALFIFSLIIFLMAFFSCKSSSYTQKIVGMNQE